MNYRYLVLVLAVVFTACSNGGSKKSKTANSGIKAEKGTYVFDKQFLKKYHDVVELKKGNSAVLLVPNLQGRVMTSTCDGKSSFGWINYDLISSGKKARHINAFGGEERFWIGPEGGQFSIYFEKGKDFVYENWFVPAEFDTEPFAVLSFNETSATFTKNMHLKNYSDIEFDVNVNRTFEILDKSEIEKTLGVNIGNLSAVAFNSVNILKNTGEKAWRKETGLLSIWLLGMFNPSDEGVVVIPVRPGDDKVLGPKVNDDYFGKISSDRLKVIDDVIFFKVDGKKRSKIGVPPLRVKGFLGSYNAANKILTILKCDLSENEKDYVNSAWKLQDNPYGGDAYNSYNDGPLDDGSQLGPFYELETSSPALALKPGETYTHSQVICHFMGDETELNEVAEKILGVSLQQISGVFKK